MVWAKAVLGLLPTLAPRPRAAVLVGFDSAWLAKESSSARLLHLCIAARIPDALQFRQRPGLPIEAKVDAVLGLAPLRSPGSAAIEWLLSDLAFGDRARCRPLVFRSHGGAVAPLCAAVNDLVDGAQPRLHGLRLGRAVDLGDIVALAKKLVTEMEAVLVIAPRLNDLVALVRLVDLDRVPVAFLLCQIMKPKREAVLQIPVEDDPAPLQLRKRNSASVTIISTLRLTASRQSFSKRGRTNQIAAAATNAIGERL